MWKLNAAFYPVTMVKTADLDPKKNHLVCCHPHGILCFGAVVRDYFFSSTDSNLTKYTDCLWCGFMWIVDLVSRHPDQDLYPSGWLNMFINF